MVTKNLICQIFICILFAFASNAHSDTPGLELYGLTGLYPQGDGKEKTIYYGVSTSIYHLMAERMTALNWVEYTQTRQEDLLGVKVRKSRMQFQYGLRYSMEAFLGILHFRGFHALAGAVILEEKHSQFGSLGDFQHQKTHPGFQTGISCNIMDIILSLDLKVDNIKQWTKEEISLFLSIGIDVFRNSFVSE